MQKILLLLRKKQADFSLKYFSTHIEMILCHLKGEKNRIILSITAVRNILADSNKMQLFSDFQLLEKKQKWPVEAIFKILEK
jgi:hypothetical protein